jgi:hypothetical protein
MQVKNGLYSIRIDMRDGKRGHATGIIILSDGHILGGDSYFYYTGSYSFKNGKWRGELITHQHTEVVGMNRHLEAEKSPVALRELPLTARPKCKAPRWLAKPVSCLLPS